MSRNLEFKIKFICPQLRHFESGYDKGTDFSWRFVDQKDEQQGPHQLTPWFLREFCTNQKP